METTSVVEKDSRQLIPLHRQKIITVLSLSHQDTHIYLSFIVAAEICGGDDETSSGPYCWFDAESGSLNTVVFLRVCRRE